MRERGRIRYGGGAASAILGGIFLTMVDHNGGVPRHRQHFFSRLKRFPNDGAPQPKIVGISILCCNFFFVVYLSRGIAPRVTFLFSSRIITIIVCTSTLTLNPNVDYNSGQGGTGLKSVNECVTVLFRRRCIQRQEESRRSGRRGRGKTGPSTPIGWGAEPGEACCDRDGTFWLNRFLNDGAP